MVLKEAHVSKPEVWFPQTGRLWCVDLVLSERSEPSWATAQDIPDGCAVLSNTHCANTPALPSQHPNASRAFFFVFVVQSSAFWSGPAKLLWCSCSSLSLRHSWGVIHDQDTLLTPHPSPPREPYIRVQQTCLWYRLQKVEMGSCQKHMSNRYQAFACLFFSFQKIRLK